LESTGDKPSEQGETHQNIGGRSADRHKKNRSYKKNLCRTIHFGVWSAEKCSHMEISRH
jgi:hypothetical protein